MEQRCYHCTRGRQRKWRRSAIGCSNQVLWRGMRRNTPCPLKSLFQSLIFSASTWNWKSVPLTWGVLSVGTGSYALQYVLHLFAGLLLSLEQLLQTSENQANAYSGGTIFKNPDPSRSFMVSLYFKMFRDSKLCLNSSIYDRYFAGASVTLTPPFNYIRNLICAFDSLHLFCFH